MSLSKRVLILCLTVLLGLYFLDQSADTNGDSDDDEELANSTISPKSFIKKGLIKSFGENGDLSLELFVEEAELYEHQNALSLTLPRTAFTHAATSTTYQISSEKGLYQLKSDAMVLEGDVVLSAKSDTHRNWDLNTSRLNFDNKSRFISTDQPVTITQDQHQLSAIGLEVDIDKKELRLLSRVRGTYHVR